MGEPTPYHHGKYGALEQNCAVQPAEAPFNERKSRLNSRQRSVHTYQFITVQVPKVTRDSRSRLRAFLQLTVGLHKIPGDS